MRSLMTTDTVGGVWTFRSALARTSEEAEPCPANCA